MSGEGTYRGGFVYDKTKSGNAMNVPMAGDENGTYVKVTDGGYFVVLESFDESGVTEGKHVIQAQIPGTKMGFGIFNNHTSNELSFTIGAITIKVPPQKPWYGVFMKATEIAIAGTGLNFDAFIEG